MALNYSKKKQNNQSGGKNDLNNSDSYKISNDIEISEAAMLEFEEQIMFWRSHLDIFIEEYLGAKDSLDIPDDENKNVINLHPFQKEIIRSCGNCRDTKDVESRSLGKTFKASLTLSSIAILYPNSPMMVISKTVNQAKEVIRFIERISNTNDNLKREIIFPITIAKDFAMVKFKNGSSIEARALNKDGSSLRGWHGKLVYVDESSWVSSDIIKSVIRPMLQFQRPIAYQKHNFKDYDSKLIETSSAYLKSADFFDRFLHNIIDIKNGENKKYVCAIPCDAGVDYGIFSRERLEDEKNLLTDSVYDMEYGAKFCGAVNGSYYPYDEVMPCRTLDKIELHQPKNSTSLYVLSLDVATSDADGADNAALSVSKLIPKRDGSYYVYMVYLATWHGKDQKFLANKVREICLRFPNITKVIIDANAIGEGVVSLLGLPYVDDNDKEYAPFVLDYSSDYGNAIPIIREYIGDNKKNNTGATTIKRYLQSKSLFFPIPYANLIRDNENRKNKKEQETDRAVLIEETAIFMETDALQIELGNIKPITISSGVKYDTESKTKHKDRYSSLLMVMQYIAELEEENRANMRSDSDGSCLAACYSW